MHVWGFGIIFEFISNLVSKFFVQKLAKFSVNLALIFSYVAVVSALTLSFYIGLSALLSSVSYVMPTEFLLLVSSYIPSNLKLCFSVVLSARLLKMSLYWSLAFRHKILDVSRV